MEHVSRLEFQIHRLGYRFTDVDLLTEALTHSVDDKKKVVDFPLKDKSYSRLTAIGNSVLKLLASHYAVQTCGFEASEGTLTNRKEELVHVENVQRRIGKKLILRDPNGKENGDNIHNCVRILEKFWNNKDFLVPYDQFLKAVLGAVFIDAGGTSGKGVEKSMEVFIKLWKDNGMLGPSEVEIKIKGIQSCFPVADFMKLFWQLNNINKPYINRVEALLDFRFSNSDLLIEALIQKTFYDQVRNNSIESILRQPDYQRLEFLGDSVLEVVIMEFMIYEHPGFQPGGLVNKMKPYVADDYLRKLALKLKLNEFLKAKPKFLSETGWDEYNDLMESVIGAMFVDGGIKKTKEFVLRVCDLHPTDGSRDKDPTLEELEYKLGYKFKDLKVLEEALIHPSATISTDVKANFRSNVGSLGLGNLLIDFYARAYVLRTCKTNAKLEALEAHRGYLCGETVVRNIAYYLQLHKLARLSPTLKEGQTPFRRYEQFVFSIFGSIYNIAVNPETRREVFNSVGEIFYRLWNPYLKHCPKSTLKECFPDSSQEQYKLRTNIGAATSF
ncbi:unnamed protein product [Orchesella dallaii]|uniref:RNase III domain-containing protein n=1 Tax=Orchesella dallaii TaxID=48710 RepID=A0ABP1RS63_9HEXA